MSAVFVEQQTVDLVTDAAGAATGHSAKTVNGRVLSIHYQKDGSTPFADGVDFTITTEATQQNVWVESNVNASKSVAPRQATHDTAGVASLYAPAGEPVEGYVFAAGERLKIVIAQGGDTKKGRFVVIHDGGRR